ncbi:GGDEF domain-containing protein [Psychrobacillus sp. NPDC096623]|uniref:GGDEF domain-containing protein n=1 Tax=Psychrobacillus sp. NPDC096623 TaxID=3364492 RepID=UPI0038281929
MKTFKMEELLKYVSMADSQVLALCMIDIDYFKRYIDFHGQLEGDRCFVLVADCLGTVMGNHKGFLSYFSGDKFICLLTDIEAEDLAQFAENLREAVENLNFKFCWQQHSFQVTISVGGVHGLVSQFKDKEEILSVADEELYKAKSTGRNNVKIKFK